jgi:hypothetical protein
MMIRRAAALIGFLLLCQVVAAEPFWGADAPRTPGTPAAELAPGEFVWSPEDAPLGPILVMVNLREQLAWVYRNGVTIGYASVSTGKPGHETPIGVFQTLQKDATHRSSTYNNAPMPYTQRLTWDGVALHAGGLPGYPSSHGCVHLPSEFARRLFEVSPLGMTVVVTDGSSGPVPTGHPAFLSPVDPRGQYAALPPLAEDQDSRWEPQRAPSGPLSLVLSTHDQRLIVMRDGVEIGRTRVDLDAGFTQVGTLLYVAHRDSASDALTWHGLAPGSRDPYELLATTGSRLAIPLDFVRRLAPLLDAGTTLVVTDAPIRPETTALPLTVLSSHPLLEG